MSEDNITRDLGRLLRAKTLSGRATKQAQGIYDALTQPKRVTLMGPPKSGKSDLLALLAGKRVVGADLALGTIRLVHGEEAHTRMVLPDGSTQTIDGLPTGGTFATGIVPVETTIAVPLPALKKISLMRLAEATTVEGQIKAMNWAANQSDIVIWCTSRFGSMEKKMWAQMPDRVRDRAFALRTTLVAFNHDIAAARSDLGKRVGDEFAFVFAADLKRALSAQISVPVDTEGMKKSGAVKVISTLLKELEQGRENALNQAELLLATYSDTGATSGVTDKVASPEVVPTKVVPEPKPEPKLPAEISQVAEVKSTPGPAKNKIVSAINDLAGDDREAATIPARSGPAVRRKDRSIFPMFELGRSEPTTDTPTPPPAPSEIADTNTVGEAAHAVPALREESIMMCEDMIVRISKLGQGSLAPTGYRGMFDAGLETLAWIDEALSDVANDDVPRFARLQQMTEEATDFIQLLRLEDTDTAALDAVTILLQMKRSVSSVLAA